MDIQVSSNFERLLFEMNGRDGGLTDEQLRRFRTTGRLVVEPDQRAKYLDGVFVASRIDDDETLERVGVSKVHQGTVGHALVGSAEVQYPGRPPAP